MSYNTELQTNNTNLQAVLTKVQNLSGADEEEDTTNKETWTLTDLSGNVLNEAVTVLNKNDVCEIKWYLYDYDIVVSNKRSFLRKNQKFSCTIKNLDPSMPLIGWAYNATSSEGGGWEEELEFYEENGIITIIVDEVQEELRIAIEEE